MTFTSGSVLTAAQLNTHLRDNLGETAPAKATTAGRIFVATGTNSLAERQVGNDAVVVSQTTSSTTFTDLATPGPAVTVTTGTTVIVILTAFLQNSSAGANSQMGYEISGAYALAADATRSLIYESGNASDLTQMSIVLPAVGITAGSNTFTAKYLVSAGTGTFHRRHIVVLPFG
jgi:hypothetical protein